jgi:DNA-binding IclR family transcriptional regulator
MASPPAQPNQSLIDGLEVLRALAVAEAPIGSRDMARRLAMEPTRANRLLKTLASIGVARQTPDRRYVCGPAMHVLSAAAMYGSGLLARSAQAVERLRPFKMHVAVGVLWQNQVVYLYQSLPAGSQHDSLLAPRLYPAERSGVGLPILSQKSDTEVRQLYRDAAPVGGIEPLLQSLRTTRAKGYAYLQRGDVRSADALGVGIGSPAFAGITLAGDIPESTVPDLIEPLNLAAAEIGAKESSLS